jgi:PTH1 family peptidyl-tRNA hydrolase
MFTIVALGNPGSDYEKTRHNAGRILMKEVMKIWKLPGVVASAKYGGEVSEGDVVGQPVRVFFPGTYMNDSGRAVLKVWNREAPENLIVVYDEIDLPLGELKLSFGRGSGGHNGLKSVIDNCQTPNFLRLRVGIAHRTIFGKVIRPTGDRLADYVLGRLSAREENKLLSVAPTAAKALEVALAEGKEKAMSIFN